MLYNCRFIRAYRLFIALFIAGKDEDSLHSREVQEAIDRIESRERKRRGEVNKTKERVIPGGWICNICGKSNNSYDGSCACGFPKYKHNQLIDGSLWLCSACHETISTNVYKCPYCGYVNQSLKAKAMNDTNE